MKTILIDSDVPSEVSRGRDPAVLNQWEEPGVLNAVLPCSPVTVAKIQHGAALWSRNRRHYPMPEVEFF